MIFLNKSFRDMEEIAGGGGRGEGSLTVPLGG